MKIMFAPVFGLRSSLSELLQSDVLAKAAHHTKRTCTDVQVPVNQYLIM